MGPRRSLGEEETYWPMWKDDIGDYADAVYPGFKYALICSSKAREEVTEDGRSGSNIRLRRRRMEAPRRNLHVAKKREFGIVGRTKNRNVRPNVQWP